MPSAIEVRGLSKSFGAVQAVDGLDFDVVAGRVTGFLGPNGSGKTTTLRILLGLVAPSAGSATFGGRRYADLDHPVHHVGAVLEATSFHPSRRAEDHLKAVAIAAKLPLGRVDETLELVGLADVARRRVGKFSLGMRQRLQLATALLGDPEILILDEPANGLDPQGIQWLRTFMRHRASQGHAVLVSSHLLAEMEETVDDVVIVSHGRLVLQTTLAGLAAHGGTRTGMRVRSPELPRLVAVLASVPVGLPPAEPRRPGHRRRHSRMVRPPRRPAPDRPLRAVPRRGKPRGRLLEPHPRVRRRRPAASGGAAPTGRSRRRRRLGHRAGRRHGRRGARPTPGGAVITGVRAEWLKIRTTAVPWVLTGIALVVDALLILVIFLDRRDNGNGGGTFVSPGYIVPHTTQQLRNLVGAGFQGYLFALLLGVLVVTTEFRHKTVTTSFLVTPRRPRFVGAKLVTSAVLGAALAVVMLAATIVGGGLTLAARGGSFTDMAHQIPAVAPGMILVFALFAILGVGVGSVLTNQVAAIVVTLGWFVILEGILVSLVHSAARWVPTGAAAAASRLTRGMGNHYGLFNWWQGMLLMLGYGLAFAAIGSYILTQRDIT